MIENAAIRLAANIKKTQKRANALKNITIPRYETLTRDITECPGGKRARGIYPAQGDQTNETGRISHFSTLIHTLTAIFCRGQCP